jgi:8-hydroxy-5-deazaflavin:NADPH oxidoreductase
MRIGVLGTGTVARTLAGGFAARGDEIVLGTRDPSLTLADPDGPVAALLRGSPAISLAGFSEAADATEMVVLAVGGGHALEVVGQAGDAALSGKVLIDVTNPLDFSRGFPPTLLVANTTSLGEQVQAATTARVVKALNTVAAEVMVDPGAVANGDHDLFLCGNDASAKQSVSELLAQRFGWRSIIDLGDVSMARGTEMYLALWVRLMAALGTHRFNVRVVR